MNRFDLRIAEALGLDMPTDLPVQVVGAGSLPSYFDVTALAIASISAAAKELASFYGVSQVEVHQGRALRWFDMTLRPIGWALANPWDPIAGDYQTKDGWIRLHTNAPHHREAALAALQCAANRGAVADLVKGCDGTELETAIIGQGGCAAVMRDIADWMHHAQGSAVASEPLIHWFDVTSSTPMGGDLRALKVLDLTRVLAGPIATRFLAGFGADVLRIDPPHWNETAVEQEVTLGKRCAGLDLQRTADRLVFKDLLRTADVFVHGYRPDALARLGFDGDTRQELNPNLIDVSLNAYGWTGPWAGRRGFDSLVQMSCGIAAEGMARSESGRPTPLPVQALDHATGYLMAAAVLRALRYRADTGRVMHARLSLARTAHLLVSGGANTLSAPLTDESDQDLAPEIEGTDWGLAQRIAFPVTIDTRLPVWTRPAGVLRRDAPEWRSH